MLAPVLNDNFVIFVYKFFMHIASSICNRFFKIVFINNYCISSENLPYIGRCKLVRAIVVFYNQMLFYGVIFRKSDS